MKLPVKLKNGTVFYVEAEPESGDVDPSLSSKGEQMGKVDDLAEVAEKKFGECLGVIEGIAQEVSDTLLNSDWPLKPDEVALDLNVGFDASGDVFFFKASSKTSLKLSLKWKTGGQSTAKS